MYEVKNSILGEIVEGLEQGITVSDAILQYIEDGAINEYVGDIVTELTALMSSQAGMEWYTLVYRACCKEENQEIWVHAVVDAYQKAYSSDEVGRCMEQAENLKSFGRLLGRAEEEPDSITEQSQDEIQSGVHTDVWQQGQPAEEKPFHSGTAQGRAESYNDQTMSIVTGYMDSQAGPKLPDIQDADSLISLAMNVRDRLKEYEDKIRDLNQIVKSQKQLIESQQEKIRMQEEELEQARKHAVTLEHQRSQMQQKSDELNQTLRRLSNIQSELRMLGVSEEP